MVEVVSQNVRPDSGRSKAGISGEDGSMNLRHRAVSLLEHWYFAREASVVTTEHPLVVVQEMHLTDGEGRTVRGSTKRTGRSQPPIRDMDYQARQVDQIMKHIGNVNGGGRKSMELYAEHRTVRNAAAKVAKKGEEGKVTAHLWREFNQGLAVLQAEIVRCGL